MDGTHQTKASDSQFISFQDFPSIHHEGDTGQAQLNINTSSHQGFNNLTNDPTGLGIIEDLQGMPDKTEASTQRNFWTIEYYQKYFNVNTNDVVERIKRSMFPHGTENYLISHIRPNPDLYGPFWICVTLIFSIAICVNLGSYLQMFKLPANNGVKYHWKYEFHIVSYAATCIFLYAWLVPLTLWGALKWTASTRDTEEELIESYTSPGLLELLCVYGYSLAIYVPIAFFWTIPIEWLQWGLVLIGTFLSGGVLLRSLLPVIAGRYRIIYIVIILGMHLLLGAGFIAAGYFYQVPLKSHYVSH
ncbi:Protein YIPF1 [Habropoda laboriosa]|uniref:Protein YIPF n=1 Tax=Habropoda laboriosa TaxID=597456 RepID=A0A0L7R7P9_9HYME|nr:PREDICTED: protein YIPF1 [Habropoda laboriosa]KOC66900.1 Protein YIPF1 [Habropoda laboriosa]